MAKESALLIRESTVYHYYKTGAPGISFKREDGMQVVGVPVTYRPVREKYSKYTCKKLREIRKETHNYKGELRR